MPQHIFSRRQALEFGWSATKQHLQFLLAATLLLLFVHILPGIITQEFDQVALPAFLVFFFFVAGVAFWIIQMIVSLGYAKISLDFARSKRPAFEELVGRAPHIVTFFLAMLLFELITTVGLLLLVVPGIIWGIKMQFFVYCIVDKNVGPIEALKMSAPS